LFYAITDTYRGQDNLRVFINDLLFRNGSPALYILKNIAYIEDIQQLLDECSLSAGPQAKLQRRYLHIHIQHGFILYLLLDGCKALLHLFYNAFSFLRFAGYLTQYADGLVGILNGLSIGAHDRNARCL
jgi:hypothetical protein